ncbi:beta-1,3-galactosyltransferase 5-like isoform X2 [Pecten maximus]|nr:beta-1,3-galactosyltransferase 5-like isoform X2 [Pecten maximus]
MMRHSNNERPLSIISKRINGWRGLMIILLTLAVPGNIYLLYYFKFAETSAHLIQTIPACDNCQKDISVNNVGKIDYCNLNQTISAVPPELLIFVLCRFNDNKSRGIIRQTWGSVKEQMAGNFRVVFVVGNGQSSKISSESSTHGDILQVDVIETYRKLTEKVTRAILWFLKRCPNINYIFKTDTDVFVNVPFILRVIRKYYLKNKIVGNCFKSYEKPDRRNNSKWRVSEKEYPGSHYPPYCSGSGYLMDRNTATTLSGVFKDTPMFPMEDVYMGFCAYKTNIDVMTVSGFHITSIGYDEFRFCHCLAVVHKLKSGKQREIWRRHELYCGIRWQSWAGYPITCLFMTSHYALLILSVVAIIIILAVIAIVLYRKRLKKELKT